MRRVSFTLQRHGLYENDETHLSAGAVLRQDGRSEILGERLPILRPDRVMVLASNTQSKTRKAGQQARRVDGVLVRVRAAVKTLCTRPQHA